MDKKGLPAILRAAAHFCWREMEQNIHIGFLLGRFLR
jgi:hypothetical protein